MTPLEPQGRILSDKFAMSNPVERICRTGGLDFVEGQLPSDPSSPAYARFADGQSNTVLYMPFTLPNLIKMRDLLTRIIDRHAARPAAGGSND